MGGIFLPRGSFEIRSAIDPFHQIRRTERRTWMNFSRHRELADTRHINSETAFLLQLLYASNVHLVFRFESADLCFARSKETDRRSNSFDVGIDGPLVQIRKRVVTAERVLPTRQT